MFWRYDLLRECTECTLSGGRPGVNDPNVVMFLQENFPLLVLYLTETKHVKTE